MQELIVIALNHAKGMWGFRWYGLAVAWVLFLAGSVWVYSQADVFDAEAQVHVDTQSILRPLLRGLAVESDVLSQVNLMTRALLGRPNLEKIAASSGLEARASTKVEYENLLNRLKSKILISSGRRRENIFTIHYEDKDPEMAYAVVRSLLDAFVGDALVSNRTESASAQEFLVEQIAEYERRLVESENRLAEFKKANVGMMPDEQGGYYDRLQTEMAQLGQVRARLNLATERRDELRRQLSGREPTLGLVTGPANQASSAALSSDPQLGVYRQQLADLRLRYTEKHPDIAALNETIAQLEQQIIERGGPVTAAPRTVSALDINPVYQDIKIALSAAEVEVAGLGSEVRQQRSRVAELRTKVDIIPEVEAELRRLNRDYGVTQIQYDRLVSSLESARLSEQADQSSEDVKFKVIEPPQLATWPVGPNRRLMMAAILLASLVAGLATTLAGSQIRPVLNSSQALSAVTGLPVLGAVSVAWTKRQLTRARLLNTGFVSAVALLGVAFLAGVYFESAGVEAIQQITRGSSQ